MKAIYFIFNTFFALPRVVRYILVGGFNTVVGYLVFVILYLLMGDSINKQIILLLSFVLSASLSFINLKIFVFRTSGNWLREYRKTFLTYIIAYIVNAVFLMLLADVLKIDVIISQAIATIITATVSYFIHKIYSFSLK